MNTSLSAVCSSGQFAVPPGCQKKVAARGLAPATCPFFFLTTARRPYIFASRSIDGRWGATVAAKAKTRKASKGKPFNLKWNRNTKLKKTSGEVYNIVGFGLPADHTFTDANLAERNTCPGALACRAVCFAKQGGYRFPDSIRARAHNLRVSQDAAFAGLVIADLSRMRSVNTVRVHDSGDFYSQEYFNAWCEVARALPHLTFYAYTKSLHFDLAGAPRNFHVTQSLGGRFDKLVSLNRPHSRIFASHAARKRARYVDGNVSDAPAIEGTTRIGLVYHGNKSLTPAQKKYFG